MIQFEINVNQSVSEEQVGDIMVTALEGGINYWCSSAEIVYNEDETYFGVKKDDQDKVIYASDVIGYGGQLILTDSEGDSGPWTLNLNKFISGLKMQMLNLGLYSVNELVDNCDADVADGIIQYALFNEIVYG